MRAETHQRWRFPKATNNYNIHWLFNTAWFQTEDEEEKEEEEEERCSLWPSSGATSTQQIFLLTPKQEDMLIIFQHAASRESLRYSCKFHAGQNCSQSQPSVFCLSRLAGGGRHLIRSAEGLCVWPPGAQTGVGGRLIAVTRETAACRGLNNSAGASLDGTISLLAEPSVRRPPGLAGY